MKMSQAMNRSFANVLFGAFGAQPEELAMADPPGAGPGRLATVEDASACYGGSIIVVPGYGMAGRRRSTRSASSATRGMGRR
jgi:NAD(P) transhydrogenase subunit beta